MDLSDCIGFANANPVCFIATTDDGQPRVRAFGMWFADETGFYFNTGGPKNVCKQLKQNPKTEICFYAPAPPPNPGTMMRLDGNVEFIEDLDLKKKVLEERPFLRALGVTGPEDPNLIVFRVPHGEAYFWTMDINMREVESEKIKF